MYISTGTFRVRKTLKIAEKRKENLNAMDSTILGAK